MNMVIYGRITNRTVKENEAHYLGTDHWGANTVVLDIVDKEYVLSVNDTSIRGTFDMGGPGRNVGHTKLMDVYLDPTHHLNFTFGADERGATEGEFKLIVDCSRRPSNALCAVLVESGSARLTDADSFVPEVPE